MKPEVRESYKKDERITTNFEAVNNDDVINKAHLGKKVSKMEGQKTYIEKDYNEFNLHNKVDLLIDRAVRTTIHFLYDKGLFDIYDYAYQV